MAEVVVYSTSACPFCDRTKALLTKWNIAFDEVRVDQSSDGLKEMEKNTNHARTVPQIMIQGRWIGGLDELTELHMNGDLAELIG